MKIKFILATLILFNTPGYSTEMASDYACKSLNTSLYTDSDREEISEYCAYKEPVRKNLPDIYWLPNKYYQVFLNNLPEEQQATRNLFLENNDNAEVSRILDNPNACHFYSSISNSVLGGYVTENAHTKILIDHQDFMNVCHEMQREILKKNIQPCSVIEIAGHSTQAIGLDTVFGVDYNFGTKRSFPSQDALHSLAQCLKLISAPTAWVVMSTCGGEVNDDGIYHYWKNKEFAQQEFANSLSLPVVSGIGPVRAASEYGENGVESPHGWHISLPKMKEEPLL